MTSYQKAFCMKKYLHEKYPLRLVEDHATKVTYHVNGHTYTKGYYLADSICSPWSTFVRTIDRPKVDAESRFAKGQWCNFRDVPSVIKCPIVLNIWVFIFRLLQF
jgi:hypothetical protein